MTTSTSDPKPNGPGHDRTGGPYLPAGGEPPLKEQDPDQARIAEMAAHIDFSDPSLTIAYGAKTMADIAKFSDGLLAQVRARDAGPVGQALSSLLARIKDANIAEDAGREPGWAARLPVVGELFNPMARAQARFNTLADGVEYALLGMNRAGTGSPLAAGDLVPSLRD